jgi:pyruvate/2-oxoglutarate dehydrogenase complex dihydrolipoamide dehydrogenase (E3) component
MPLMTRYDVVVIGLGRAGSAVADAAAAAGRKVAAVRFPDSDDQADHLSYALENAAHPQPGPVRFEVLQGPAAFVNAKTLSVNGAEISARHFVLAVGALPQFPEALDGVRLMSPLDVLGTPGAEVRNAVVLGGGPVAVVVADRLRSAGGQVTIVSRSARLLPKEDVSVSDALAGRLRARGIQINLGVSDFAPLCRGGETIVGATGLSAVIGGLSLEKAGVLLREGRVVVNDELRTSNPKIFAAGHAVEPGAPLAVQDHQAEVVSANLTAPFWARRRIEPGETPFSLRTSVPVARVGLTEAQAREKFTDVITAMVPYVEAQAAEGEPGMIKVVGRRRHGVLLGAHVVGLGAAELILFFDLLIRSEIPIPDVPDRRHFPLPGPSDAAFRALTAWAAAT